MAEHEIIKHTKKAFTILKSSNMDLKNKVTDILTEILIIVFAVSISIWLTNWSESRQDHKEEKEFLIGFKKDLQSEIINMTKSKEFYIKTLHGIGYFLSIGKGAALNKDSINKYSYIFFSSTDLDPHISRYEGLKSSGKFKIIENKELLNNIIDLQETIIQRIQTLNEKYYQHTQKLEALIGSFHPRMNSISSINKKIAGVVKGFTWGAYWSSSEFYVASFPKRQAYAWTKIFYNETAFYSLKDRVAGVRAIRAF